MKKIRYLGTMLALCSATLLPLQAQETQPPDDSVSVETSVPTEEAFITVEPTTEPTAQPPEETPPTPLSESEIDELLSTSNYSDLMSLLAQDEVLNQRWSISILTGAQASRFTSLYRSFSIQSSQENNQLTRITNGSTKRKARSAIGSYDQLVQSSAFILGDGVSDNDLKYLYNGNGTTGDALVVCKINDRNEPVNGNADARTKVNDDATIWIPHAGTWYGEPVGMSIRLIRNVNGTGASQSIMLQPNDWGTNFYYEDITDITNIIDIYQNVDYNNPHVNGEKISFDTNYAIFAGSHGLTDEDLTWNGVHYRSAEASGPVDSSLPVYTDHVDWVAQGTSDTGKTVYYSNEYMKTIRVSFDVSKLDNASFYLGIVNRGGTSERSQDGGVDFNGWNNTVQHSTFVVVDPNGGTYLGSSDKTHHEGLANETVTIEDSIRPGYMFKGYKLIQTLGNWDGNTKTYTYGTPEENGIRYGVLQAQWQKISLQWKIEKKVDLLEANVGDELTYTITVSAPSDESSALAESMTIIDSLPKGTEFISADNDGSFENNQVSWTFSNVPTNQKKTVTFRVRITQEAQKEITNNATLQTTWQNETQEITSNTVKTVLHASDLSIQKSVDLTEADIEDQLTYTITITNHGQGTAKSYTITDELPENTTYVSGGSYDLSTNTVSFQGTNLQPNKQEVFTFTVQITPNASGTILNSASLTGEDYVGKIPGKSSNQVETSILEPNVSVIKSVSPDHGIDINGELTWTFTATNNGGGTARFVHIADDIPENTTYIEDSLTTAEFIEGQYVNNNVHWILSSLKPGETRTVSYRTRVNHDITVDEITNTGIYATTRLDDASGFDFIPETPTNMVTVPLLKPEVSLIKSADAEDQSFISTKQILTYTLTIQNTGAGTAGWITLVDEIPEYTEFVSAENNGVYNSEKNRVEWLVHDLFPNDTLSVTYQVRILDDTVGKQIRNVAKFEEHRLPPGTPGTFENDPIKESNVVTHTVGKPEVEIIKTANPKNGNPVANGQTVEYTLTITNKGNAIAHYVPIRDTLPDGVKLASDHSYTVDEGGTYFNGDHALEWLITELKPNETRTLSIRVKVSTQNGEILNQAFYDVLEENPGRVGTWKTTLTKKSNAVRHTVDTRQAVVTTAVRGFPYLLTVVLVLSAVSCLFIYSGKKSRS